MKRELTPEQHEQLRERMNELADRAQSHFEGAVRPIYGATRDGDSEHIGSCILLDLKGVKILLTAAHVMHWNEKTSLYVGGPGEFVLVEANFVCTPATNEARKQDRYDFAAARLTDETAVKLGNHFVPQSDIITSPTTRPHYLTALGYPNSQNRHHRLKGGVKPILLFYSDTAKLTDTLAAKYGEAGRHHLFLGYEKYSRDEACKRVSPIAPEGISGGAVIDAGNLSDLQVFRGEFTPTPRPAGMVIEFWKEKVLVATSLHCILPVLLQKLT